MNMPSSPHSDARPARKKLAGLLLIALFLVGCGSEDRKPELTPEILTSAPHATNLRKYTVPEGMQGYVDLYALREAAETEDIQLAGVDVVYLLDEDPEGLTPEFNALNGEVMVVYSSLEDNDRSLLIHQYPSLEPELLLDARAPSHTQEEIGEETFYFVDPEEPADWEAYTIQSGWLIHVKAFGFSGQEFRDFLQGLEAERL